MSTILELDNNFSTIIMITSLEKGRHFIRKITKLSLIKKDKVFKINL